MVITWWALADLRLYRLCNCALITLVKCYQHVSLPVWTTGLTPLVTARTSCYKLLSTLLDLELSWQADDGAPGSADMFLYLNLSEARKSPCHPGLPEPFECAAQIAKKVISEQWFWRSGEGWPVDIYHRLTLCTPPQRVLHLSSPTFPTATNLSSEPRGFVVAVWKGFEKQFR